MAVDLVYKILSWRLFADGDFSSLFIVGINKFGLDLRVNQILFK